MMRLKKIPLKRLQIILVILDIVLCGAFLATKAINRKTPVDVKISESSIRRICELATLDCFYHNVSEWENPGDFLNAGKKLWMEYDGIIRVGIKAEKLEISDPDKDGVITVRIPPATILAKDLDEQSIYEIDSTSPLWGFVPIYGSVSTEERRDALAGAQKDMEASAEKNEMVLAEALDRAKKIIERNIVALGEAGGKQYTVRFEDISEEPAVPQETQAQ